MDTSRLQEELDRTRHELVLLYEVGKLIRTSLELDEVIYLILSAVTSHEGLGYNRAVLFMVDETGTFLEGKMGIGPKRPETSTQVWKMIQDHKIQLEGLLDVYRKADKNIDPELNSIVQQVKLPIEKKYGILAKTVIYGNPAIITPTDAKHELGDLNLQNLGFQQFAVVPLRGKDHIAGVLVVDNVSTRKPILPSDLNSLSMLADHAGLALENAKSYTEVKVHSQQDSLTKLWNHGHFQELLHDTLKEARIKKEALSLVVFDIDNFKAYNDTFGHPAGDRALEEVSSLSKTVMRRFDYLARYGGEEFAAVLPATTKKEALKLAERLRLIVERETAEKLPKSITISVGIASYPEDADEKEKLIFCADGALYEAKRAGKNRVFLYEKTR